MNLNDVLILQPHGRTEKRGRPVPRHKVHPDKAQMKTASPTPGPVLSNQPSLQAELSHCPLNPASPPPQHKPPLLDLDTEGLQGLLLPIAPPHRGERARVERGSLGHRNEPRASAPNRPRSPAQLGRTSVICRCTAMPESKQLRTTRIYDLTAPGGQARGRSPAGSSASRASSRGRHRGVSPGSAVSSDAPIGGRIY
ncbi:hypothetical protein HJG60_011796 [Phyllostomus discolor]|uniref:Uncharacterized protein n=1 Tax=Phyllostomus discolor TaxID=89673 RepID=A0A834DVX8_9CHIR|nr:hypothetical protein HJG60_011796 [Phyllostomus discolor]